MSSHPDPVVPATTRPFRVAGDALPELRQSLTDLAKRIRGVVDAVDGVGVTVQLGDHVVFAGSNAFTQAVDALQYGMMQGPCLAAHTTGAVVRSAEIGAGEPRWPRFTRPAAELGLRSVVSSPLVVADRVVGSLNLYGTAPRRFDALEPTGRRTAVETVEQELGGVVWTAVAQANAQWFAAAVRDRADIDLAVGVLQARYAISVTEAQVLISQLGIEDGVSDVVAARAVLQEDGGR